MRYKAVSMSELRRRLGEMTGEELRDVAESNDYGDEARALAQSLLRGRGISVEIPARLEPVPVPLAHGEKRVLAKVIGFGAGSMLIAAGAIYEARDRLAPHAPTTPRFSSEENANQNRLLAQAAEIGERRRQKLDGARTTTELILTRELELEAFRQAAQHLVRPEATARAR